MEGERSILPLTMTGLKRRAPKRAPGRESPDAHPDEQKQPLCTDWPQLLLDIFASTDAPESSAATAPDLMSQDLRPAVRPLSQMLAAMEGLATGSDPPHAGLDALFQLETAAKLHQLLSRLMALPGVSLRLCSWVWPRIDLVVTAVNSSSVS